jgi:hypothetical protein
MVRRVRRTSEVIRGQREAMALAGTLGAVVRAGRAANRALLALYPHIVDAAFPGSSRRWCRALTTSSEPPAGAGLVWFDPATDRLTEHRRATMAA